ncbi:hypothetical protein B4102_4036 [Heyndrickxia sporothermodurans]|uniref:SpoVT-AbrB domain-containing protein n=1 Tax=Heyndrickxia sporothermodurans TaxID=46224 RepID=A0A150KLL7_9BACI|nr:AbrB/MazE/SpoVT family DNA-binding domain-containing protein [Heyndrickxia sporothermodurans]KYC88504.1 hypothetical protein B4102_4036 [Heyndrickxia sporothermodurans]
MKSTGIVRKVDELGRIVIPKELRKTLDIEEKDPVEVFLDEELIILRKYKPDNSCIITGEVTSENKTYVGNIILSPQGASILQEEIKKNIYK